jgi:hypothetical protein
MNKKVNVYRIARFNLELNWGVVRQERIAVPVFPYLLRYRGGLLGNGWYGAKSFVVFLN